MKLEDELHSLIGKRIAVVTVDVPRSHKADSGEFVGELFAIGDDYITLDNYNLRTFMAIAHIVYVNVEEP